MAVSFIKCSFVLSKLYVHGRIMNSSSLYKKWYFVICTLKTLFYLSILKISFILMVWILTMKIWKWKYEFSQFIWGFSNLSFVYWFGNLDYQTMWMNSLNLYQHTKLLGHVQIANYLVWSELTQFIPSFQQSFKFTHITHSKQQYNFETWYT